MNLEKLKEKINTSGYKMKFIARKLDLTYSGLALKLNGSSAFKWNEVEALSKLLNLSLEEKENIFFNN